MLTTSQSLAGLTFRGAEVGAKMEESWMGQTGQGPVSDS